jgi:maleylpyruvate isomerase
MPDEAVADALHDATQRLVRTIDAIAPEAWSEPSGLPGWSRAHVVAHLTLNAEGLAEALGGVVQGNPTPMYRSPEARDADIEELSGHDPTDLRDRLLASTTNFADALTAIPDEGWSMRIERTPGSERAFTAHAVPGMRWREVEIHHVDLASSYTHDDWPASFAIHLVQARTTRADVPAMLVRATDVDQSWEFGAGGPVVTGRVADLGWWLTGRGVGEGLTSDSGELPRMGAW